MAIENLDANDLLAFEDQVLDVATKLRELRNKMEESGTDSLPANAGTFRYALEKLQRYSTDFAHRYEKHATANALRVRMRAKKPTSDD